MGTRGKIAGSVVEIGMEIASSAQSGVVAQIIRAAFAKQVELLGVTQDAHPNYAGFETSELVEARMKQGSRVALVFVAGEPAGTVGYGLDADREGYGYIERMAVISDLRGMGLGNALLEYAEHQLVNIEASFARLSIVAQFYALQSFYERAGYILVAEVKPPRLPFKIAFMEKKLNCLIQATSQEVQGS